ncbi:tape measure protein [Prevotella sp.]|uniref:tape measure protein n=1 Tax=Prevotella sp. TaxID=59823 RepID=UPI0025DAAF7B|nr:tape measure protein [Prevotella sp.]
MANSIDNRVAQLTLENKQFEAAAAQSLKTVNKLDDAFKMADGVKGMKDLGEATKSVNVEGLLNSANKVRVQFVAMEEAARQLIRSVTQDIYQQGKALVKGLTIDPIQAGWTKYSEKLSSVQTLMNATGKDIDTINTYLDRLMWFSDETSYGFTDMTSALAQMTASGGDVEKLIPMIQGIANATAFAGKGAAEFSRVMYNLNQSYSAGYLSLMDWKSVELAGASSKELKNILIDTAKQVGTLNKEGKTAAGTLVDISTFSSTLADKWATTEVMEKAFGYFNEMTEMAYKMVQSGQVETASEAYEILASKYDTVSLRAAKAAQEAKSFSETIEATKDAVSTNWMQTFENIFGNKVEATKLWTAVTQELWEIFAAGGARRNEILAEWAQGTATTIREGLQTGREALFEGIGGFYNNIKRLVTTTKTLWRDFFPETTADRLVYLTYKFRDFMKTLTPSSQSIARFRVGLREILAYIKPSGNDLNALNTAFHGLMDILGMGVRIGARFVGSFSPLIRLFSYIGTQVINLAGYLGKLLTGMSGFRGYESVFDAFSNGLSWLVDKIIAGVEWAKQLGLAFANFVSPYLGKAYQTVKGWLDIVTDYVKTNAPGWLEKVADNARTAWGFIKKLGTSIKTALGPSIQKIGGYFSSIYGYFTTQLIPGVTSWVDGLLRAEDPLAYISTSLANIRDKAIAAWNSGAISSWASTAKKRIGDLWESVKKIFGDIRTRLSQLTVADIAKGGLGLTGIIVLAQLVGLMNGLEQAARAIASLGTAGSGFIADLRKTLTSTTANNVRAFAVSIGILAASMKLLSTIPKEQLWEIVAVIGVLSGILLAFNAIAAKTAKSKAGSDTANAVRATMRPLESLNEIGKSLATAVNIVAIGAAVLMLSSALTNIVKTVQGVSWPDLGKAMMSMVLMMGYLAAFSILLAKYAPKLSKGAIGLVFFAGAIWLLVEALGTLLKSAQVGITLEQNMVTLLGILAALALFARFIPAKGGIGMLGLVLSLYALVGVFKIIAENASIFTAAGPGIWNLLKIITRLSVLMLMLQLVSSEINTYTKQKASWISLGLGMAAMAGALLILVKVAKLLDKLKINNNTINQLGWLVIALSLMALAAGAAAGMGKSINAFLGLSVALAAMVLALYGLVALASLMDSINAEEMKGSFIILGSLMLAMGAFLALAGLGAHLGKGLGLAYLIVEIGVIASVVVSLIALSNLCDPTALSQVSSSLEIVGAILSGVMLVMAISSAIAKKGGWQGLLYMTGMLVPLAGVVAALVVMKNMGLDSALDSAIALGIVIVALGAALALAGSYGSTLSIGAMLAFAGGIALISGAMWIFTKAIGNISGDLQRAWGAIKLLGSIFGVLAVVMAIFSIPAVSEFALLGAIVLAALGAALLVVASAAVVMAVAIRKLAEVPWEGLADKINSIIGPGLKLAGVLALVGLAGVVLLVGGLVGAVGALALAGGIAVLSVAVRFAIDTLYLLVTAIDWVMKAFGKSNGAIDGKLDEIQAASDRIEAMTAQVEELERRANAATSGGDSALADTSAATAEHKARYEAYNETIEEATASTDNFTNSVENMTDTLANSDVDTAGFMDNIKDMISKGGEGLKTFLGDFLGEALGNIDISGLQDLFGGKLSEIINNPEAIKESISEMTSGLVSGFEEKISALTNVGESGGAEILKGMESTDYESSGRYAAEGIAKGLFLGLPKIRAAAAVLGDTVKNAYNNRIEIASPSKVMMWSGEMTAEGVVVGMLNRLVAIRSAASQMSMAAVEGFNQNATDVMASGEAAMTFTPVVDMTNLSPANVQQLVGNAQLAVASQLAEDRQAAKMTTDLNSMRAQITELVALNAELIEIVRQGGDVYLDGDVVAGSVNARLGGLV